MEFSSTLAIGIAGFVLLWPISLVKRDASVVDFWWGPGMGALGLGVWLAAGQPVSAAVLALLLPLWIWSARLGVHLGIRRLREGGEDPRYTDLRTKFSPGWWWKSLFVVFLLQGVLQVLAVAGVLAAIPAAATAGLSPLIAILSAIALAAVAVETLSDLQLDRHKATTPEHSLLTTGLRGIVRYPSYSAEVVFWTAMNAIAMLVGVWWAVAPLLLMVLLLRYVSGVAILEDRLDRTRPDFGGYRQAVPMLIPRWRGPLPGAGEPAE